MEEKQLIIEDQAAYDEFVRKTADSPERERAKKLLEEAAVAVQQMLSSVKELCEEHMLDFEAKLGDGYYGEVKVRFNGLPVIEEDRDGHYDYVTHKFIPNGKVHVYVHFPYDQKSGWEAGNQEYWQSSSRGC